MVMSGRSRRRAEQRARQRQGRGLRCAGLPDSESPGLVTRMRDSGERVLPDTVSGLVLREDSTFGEGRLRGAAQWGEGRDGPLVHDTTLERVDLKTRRHRRLKVPFEVISYDSGSHCRRNNKFIPRSIQMDPAPRPGPGAARLGKARAASESSMSPRR